MATPNKRAKRPQKRKPEQPAGSVAGGQAVVQNRNRVAYGLAGKSLRVAWVSGVLGTCGVVFGVLGWTMQPEPTYFAVKESGTLIELHPLSEPVKSSPQITNWVARALTESLAMDWRNYKQQLGRAEQYFTSAGFNQFIKAWKESGNLESVVKNRYVTEATLSGTPVIAREKEVNGRHYWQIKVPVMIGYHSAKKTLNQELTALVTIVRVNTLENKHGVAIQQIIFEDA